MIEQNQLEASIAKAAADVRANNPLAGSITNTVTIDFVANAQLHRSSLAGACSPSAARLPWFTCPTRVKPWLPQAAPCT